MFKPQFNTIPLYPYDSGQMDLVQYSLCQAPDGTLFFGNQNERLDVSQSNISAYQFTFKDKCFITAADFDDKSMLATDMGRALSKTAAVFVTHFRFPDNTDPLDVDGTSINISVGKFVENRMNYVVCTFITNPSVNTRRPIGLSFYCITSSTNQVRS